MFGVNLNIKEAMRTTFDGFRNEAFAKIPGYSWMSTMYRRMQANERLKGPKKPSNTVDDDEFKRAKNKIETEIGGSWNPIKWLWGSFQSLIGNTRNERIVAAIKEFENYGHQYEGYRFVHEAQDFLLTEIERRISAIETMGSKYLGTSNDKVINDPVLSALTFALKSWLEPFNKISHGEVQEITRLTESDVKFIMNMRDRIRYSPKARYIEDLIPEYDQAIEAGRRSLYNVNQAPNHPAKAIQRANGQQLARKMGA